MLRQLALAATLACAVLVPLLVPRPVLAAGVATLGDKAVLVPYGDWIVGLGDTLGGVLVPVLAAALLWSLRTYMPVLGLFASQALVERLVRNAADYGLNAVAGAVKGRVLDVPTGSQVIAKAAQRAVDQAPAWLLETAGGPAGIAEKVFRSLPLAENATAAAVLAPALRAIRAGRAV